MNTGILLSTAYFPNIHYLELLKKNPEATVDLGEFFVKQTLRNRALILGPNGVQKLIVPLIRWKQKTRTRDIRISYDSPWQKIHWKSLESSYRSSPYFEFYESQLNEHIHEKHNFLKDLNESTWQFALSVLKLECRIRTSSEYIEEWQTGSDFRGINEKKYRARGKMREYHQVFSSSFSFVPDLSCIDLICNEGPNAIHLLD